MINLNSDDRISILIAMQDTMDLYCEEAGASSSMRVYTNGHGMYSVNAASLNESFKALKSLDDTITLITGSDLEGREYSVCIPLDEISLIIDPNYKIAYETDKDYLERVQIRKNKTGGN